MSEPISSTTQALVSAHEDWKAQHAGDVIVYAEGLCFASVCTSLDDDGVSKAMAARPSGTTGGWTRSADTHFTGGQPNPCPCEVSPESRRHILFEA